MAPNPGFGTSKAIPATGQPRLGAQHEVFLDPTCQHLNPKNPLLFGVPGPKNQKFTSPSQSKLPNKGYLNLFMDPKTKRRLGKKVNVSLLENKRKGANFGNQGWFQKETNRQTGKARKLGFGGSLIYFGCGGPLEIKRKPLATHSESICLETAKQPTLIPCEKGTQTKKNGNRECGLGGSLVLSHKQKPALKWSTQNHVQIKNENCTHFRLGDYPLQTCLRLPGFDCGPCWPGKPIELSPPAKHTTKPNTPVLV